MCDSPTRTIVPTLVRGGIMRIRSIGTAIFILLVSHSAFAQNEDQTAAIEKTVAYCVNVVHTTRAAADDPFGPLFYKHFDAFYNPASGLVENSARLEGEQRPLFIFKKCMSEQGVPLTSGAQQTVQTHAAVCTHNGAWEADGDCWIRLSSGEKQIVANAFREGAVAAFVDIKRQMYSREGMNPVEFPRVPEHLVAGLDALYAVPENRTISFMHASDLVERTQVSRTNSDLPYLMQMYRDDQEPLVRGYIKKFVPPNKLVIAEWNDSADQKAMAQRYGNSTQTITMLGIADSPASDAMTNFMNALVNLKSCHTLWTKSDGLSHMKNLPDGTQKNMRNGFSAEMDAVVIYPNETDVGPQFFNAKGELSGEILLDMNDDVCYRPDDQFGTIPVKLGDLMFGNADRTGYEAWLESNSKRFVSLNAFVLGNHLQPAADMGNDPRPKSRIGLYLNQPNPLPDAITTVIRVGAGT